MATSNQYITTTIQALEDLSSCQYLAIALNDGLLANNADETTGIILNKPKSGEFATVGYTGEMKFLAGAAISAGARITVTTSGYFTQADSNDTCVGVAKVAVSSGGYGTGFFSFATPAVFPSAFTYSVTAADAISQGKGYTLQDNKLANTYAEVNGVAPAAITSGSTGQIVVCGIVTATYADSYGAGAPLCCVASGYFSATVASGTSTNAISLTAAASGSNGTVMFFGGTKTVHG